MAMLPARIGRVTLLLAAFGFAGAVFAAEIGQIKTVKGSVTIERGGHEIPGWIGTRLVTTDVVKTGADAGPRRGVHAVFRRGR